MDTPLDAAEVDAIREAMQSSTPAHASRGEATDDEVAPLSIIADDRAAMTARPLGHKLGEKWARALQIQLRLFLGTAPEVTVVSSDAVEGPSIRNDLLAMWTQVMSPVGRPGDVLIGVGGDVIESLAARQLGAQDSTATGRGPSATSLRLFAPVGETICNALSRAWKIAQDCSAVVIDDDERTVATTRHLLESEILIAIALEVKGEVEGKILCIARPETLVPSPPTVDAIPAPPGAIQDALGEVPVELRVQLGRTEMSRREVARLSVGNVIPLQQFIGDPLPIECAGVVKAHGRAKVHRGVLAVEVAADTNREDRA